MVVGVTGGIGSGKSFVAESFLKHDNTVYYHADEEAKKLMNNSLEIKELLTQEFGNQSFENGKLNRKYISSIVFKDPDKLNKLNSIVHPHVKSHFLDFIKLHTKEKIIIYENAILFEIGSDGVCNTVINVFAPKEERIKRVVSRDKTSEKEVLERMQSQWSDEKKNLLSNYIICNINKEETLLKVQQIHNFLTEKQYLF